MTALGPLRLGVFVETTTTSGGNFQNALNTTILLRSLPAEVCTPIVLSSSKEVVSALAIQGLDVKYIRLSKARRLLEHFRSSVLQSKFGPYLRGFLWNNYLEKALDTWEIDLVLFCNHTSTPLLLEQTNFIFTLLDICHRDQCEFPEFRNGYGFEKIEQLFRAVLPKSVGVLVDSPTARTRAALYYGLDPDRLHVMPFAPSLGARQLVSGMNEGAAPVKAKYGLTEDFVFYPAQFWPHKNHAYILRALRILEDKFGIRLGAVFAGGLTGGNQPFVKSLAEKIGLSERIKFVGFVSDAEISVLYREAIALVMPTYFGPTNMPPLEAFLLGTPVLYSDLPGLREQVQEAALLVDLKRPETLANQLSRLLREPGLRETLIQRGFEMAAEEATRGRLEVLVRLFETFNAKKAAWS